MRIRYGAVTIFPSFLGTSFTILTSFERNEINQSTSKISAKVLHKTSHHKLIYIIFQVSIVVIAGTKLHTILQQVTKELGEHNKPVVLPKRILVQLWNNKGSIQNASYNDRICYLQEYQIVL
eukprot:TRINITY_DN3336_c0_g2_i1.p1 TRINITY_DN3336_c0_g2~~TRINITY_DN3336_c0_g2_i1.p1  ORF type:complete len:122 (-),score=3.12 TRINITY_DN3336_c0_g2_i1:813-1178(-)